MKAVLCRELGGPEVLSVGEIDAPEPGPGEVRIAIHAAGVNFADTLMLRGKYQEKPPLPFSPGMEAAGVVDALGEGVDGFAVGDRVMAMLGWGGFAEAGVSKIDRTIRMPDSMSMVDGAAFPVVYGTSHVALAHRAHLQAGETLLVHGAAGGVGYSAVQIGKAMGATVIGTARGADKLEVAREAGADHVFDYSETDIRDTVLELTDGKGADVIYDPVGGDVFDASLRCIAWEGRILIIGFAAGRIPEIPANRLLLKSASAVGVFWGAYRLHNSEVIGQSFEELFRMYDAGKLKPRISKEYQLEEAAQAYADLENRKVVGKAVVVTGLSE
jgi:NADPH2:quinone reductase